MTDNTTNLERAQRYLRCIEAGNYAGVAELFASDAVVEQLPNRIYPAGLRSGVAEMAGAFERGRRLLSKQTYEIKSSAAEGDRIALEVLWTGTLALPFGALAAGAEMRAHSAMFLEFREGKIVSQRNYDCFESW